MRLLRTRAWHALALAVAVTSLTGALACGASGTSRSDTAPSVRHVFVINLENKGYANTFGAASPAPYLAKTLASQGALLSQYYGIGHVSLDNYIAQVSGQGPNIATQTDCQLYIDFVQLATVAPGQAVGQGCVFPTAVKTIADQLASAGLTWKGYMEDMGNIPSREAATCGHPALNSQDKTQSPVVGDQYATRHNPFVYFHSIVDSPSCKTNVVPLTALPADLQSVATTPNLTYITPNLCNDGHDAPCVDGKPGGLVSADAWLQTWVPRIMASPAFQADGLLVVTFDESDGPQSDASACCGEGPGPNSPLPGLTGLGGGRVGAVVLSRQVRPGTVSANPYNHYSVLATIEQIFGVGRLGYAAKATSFGADVFTAAPS
jgi:phospholipase C